MSHRLTSKQRIRKRDEFKALHEKGIFAKGSFLNVWASVEETTGTKKERPKIGIVVSRKVSAKANLRNRWKRLIKEVFRLNQNKIKPNAAVMIQVKPGTTIPEQSLISREIERLLTKAKCYKDHE